VISGRSVLRRCAADLVDLLRVVLPELVAPPGPADLLVLAHRPLQVQRPALVRRRHGRQWWPASLP
jgi:hypothetical protein